MKLPVSRSGNARGALADFRLRPALWGAAGFAVFMLAGWATGHVPQIRGLFADTAMLWSGSATAYALLGLAANRRGAHPHALELALYVLFAVTGGVLAALAVSAWFQHTALTFSPRNFFLSLAFVGVMTLLPVTQRLSEYRRERRLAELHRVESERLRIARQLTEARLTTLQAQVEPHFLHNTLANVQYLLRHDVTSADAMLEHLIGYLQTAVPRMRENTSTLTREIDLARHYLAIMQIRMGTRLRFTIDLPDDMAQHPFPPMMLISLVENAVQHGLEPKTTGGTVRIAARREGALTVLEVADDGVGFTRSEGSGIGLANLVERLTSLFDGAAELVVQADAEGGTLTQIRVPTQR